MERFPAPGVEVEGGKGEVMVLSSSCYMILNASYGRQLVSQIHKISL